MNLENLSKIISHALRHDPKLYHVTIDEEGWVDLEALISGLKKNGIEITKGLIIEMVEKSKKKRHEISNNKIRAIYGHSIMEKIIKQPQTPPKYLYHGTIKKNYSSIMLHGLLPIKRQYVHLSLDLETAKTVSNRRKGEKVILIVRSYEAFKSGISFYKEVNNVWLSDPIPSRYINFNNGTD